MSKVPSAVGAFLQSNLVFRSDIEGLINALKITHDSSEWRLFVDSLKLGLKAVQLPNGNRLPSIPVAHAVRMKETYDNLASYWIPLSIKCIAGTSVVI